MEPGSLGSPGLPVAVSLGYQAFGRLRGRRRAREAFSFLDDAWARCPRPPLGGAQRPAIDPASPELRAVSGDRPLLSVTLSTPEGEQL